MRVISGMYKGMLLKSPQTSKVRPTGDKTKQALFTKLQFFVKEAVVLDLFSGSGALGIEALSRGAKFVCFVDKDSQSIKLTKENLNMIKSTNYKVIHMPYSDALKCMGQKFDLILVDPPYASGYYDEVMELIVEYELLNKDGYVVCEHLCGTEINTTLKLVDKKRYGTVELSYYQQN